MLIYHHKERRRKQSRRTNDCVHRYYQLTFISSFFIQLFIASTIMAIVMDHSVAMDILNDRSINGGNAQVLNDIKRHNRIVLNEKLPPQKVNFRGYSSMVMPLVSKSHGRTDETAANKYQSKPVRENTSMPPCICWNGKSTKFHVSSCMQICGRQQQQQQQRQHQQHSSKFKRKRKPSINQRKFTQKRTEHLTLIYGIDAISNSTQSKKNERIVPIQSSELTAAKFRRKSQSYYHRQHYNDNVGDGAAAAVAAIVEKSLNNGNAHETNKPDQIQVRTPTNLQEMAFYSSKHLGNFQNIDIKNNRWQSNAIDDAIDEPKILKNEIVQSGDGKNFKRKIRSLDVAPAATITTKQEGVEKLPSTRIDATNMTDLVMDSHKTVLSATKDSSSIKSTVNGIFDSSTVRGGIAEIIGSLSGVAATTSVASVSTDVDANHNTAITTTGKNIVFVYLLPRYSHLPFKY